MPFLVLALITLGLSSMSANPRLDESPLSFILNTKQEIVNPPPKTPSTRNHHSLPPSSEKRTTSVLFSSSLTPLPSQQSTQIIGIPGEHKTSRILLDLIFDAWPPKQLIVIIQMYALLLVVTYRTLRRWGGFGILL